MADQARFRIFRYNPEEGGKPRYQEYTVEICKGATVLDCLNEIKDKQDGTVSYRMSCRSAICGSCAIRINGHAKLACKTQASDVLEVYDRIQLDPMANMDHIKDLIVDMEPFWTKIEELKPWLRPSSHDLDGSKEIRQFPEGFNRIKAAAQCIMCGACFSECSTLAVDKDFLGPHALAKGQRFVDDTRDADTVRRLNHLGQKEGIWSCCHCYECYKACPKDTKPVVRIGEVKEAYFKEGMPKSHGSKHVDVFYTAYKRSGKLNETTMAFEIMGLNLFWWMRNLTWGMKMQLKGKAPSPFQKPVEKIDEVRKLFDIARKRREESHK